MVETGPGAELRRRRTYMLSLLWSPKSISLSQDVVGFGADRKEAARLDSSSKWLLVGRCEERRCDTAQVPA
jgi:hypothetical protein